MAIGPWTPHDKGLNHLKPVKLATIKVFTKSTAQDSDAIRYRMFPIEYAPPTIDIYRLWLYLYINKGSTDTGLHR